MLVDTTLFIAVFFGLSILGRTMFDLTVPETGWMYYAEMTQRKRYVILLVSAVLCTPTFLVIAYYGWSSVVYALGLYWSIPFWGWAITIVYVILLFSPIILSIDWILIYRRPSGMARKIGRNRWVATSDCRRKRRGELTKLPIYERVIMGPNKLFLPINE